MSVQKIVSNVGAVLLAMPGADSVFTEPPQVPPTETFFVVYCRPGSAAPFTHTSRGGGGPVWKAEDVIAVDWHYPISQDPSSEVVNQAYRTLDLARSTLAAAFVADNFGGSVLQASAVATQYFGPMEYASALTFGFRLSLSVSHTFEADGRL